MKVMFVIPRMNGGGAERVVANLANALVDNNSVRIVSIISDESFYKLHKKIEFKRCSIKIRRKNIVTTFLDYLKNFLKALHYIKENIKDFEPDCVISFLVETDILTYLATHNNDKIIKVYSERNDPTKRSMLKKVIIKKIYKEADLFVCQSKKVFDYYSYIPSCKKTIIPNPLSDDINNYISTELNHNIVSVGRFFEQKNFELLIRSFIESVDSLPKDCNLIIYGDGPLRDQYQKIIDSSNLADRILLPGSCKDVFDKIKDSALFVMSSNYEGFPNVLVEAMGVGLPVISTDFFTGVAKELIKEKNGIVVPVGDLEKLKSAIIEIMNNDLLRLEMRNKNTFVREKFDSLKISKIWIENINRIKKGRGK